MFLLWSLSNVRLLNKLTLAIMLVWSGTWSNESKRIICCVCMCCCWLLRQLPFPLNKWPLFVSPLLRTELSDEFDDMLPFCLMPGRMIWVELRLGYPIKLNPGSIGRFRAHGKPLMDQKKSINQSLFQVWAVNEKSVFYLCTLPSSYFE